MLHVMRCSYPGDGGKLQRMTLIEEGDEKKVRAQRLQQNTDLGQCSKASGDGA